MTSELTQALLKALEAGNYNAAPTKLVQGTGYYPLGDDPRMKTDPVEELEAHARQHQQECWCDIKLPVALSFVHVDFLIPGGYPEHPGQCECDIKDLMSVGHDKDCCEHPSKKKPPTEK